jgi:hypothetical protein
MAGSNMPPVICLRQVICPMGSAAERKQGAGGHDVTPLAMLSQLLKREALGPYSPGIPLPPARPLLARCSALASLARQDSTLARPHLARHDPHELGSTRCRRGTEQTTCPLPHVSLVAVFCCPGSIQLMTRNGGSCWAASVAQEAVEDSAFLEPDGGAAGVGQQPVHLGLEPASKDVPRVVGSVGQIRIGRTGFTADLMAKFTLLCTRIRTSTLL